jgi:hypothetical protein
MKKVVLSLVLLALPLSVSSATLGPPFQPLKGNPNTIYINGHKKVGPRTPSVPEPSSGLIFLLLGATGMLIASMGGKFPLNRQRWDEYKLTYQQWLDKI